jgi:hypothetical protein
MDGILGTHRMVAWSMATMGRGPVKRKTKLSHGGGLSMPHQVWSQRPMCSHAVWTPVLTLPADSVPARLSWSRTMRSCSSCFRRSIQPSSNTSDPTGNGMFQCGRGTRRRVARHPIERALSGPGGRLGWTVTDDSEPIAVRASMLFFRRDSVLLCRRTDEDHVYVLPGGTPAHGEGTAAAARREVAEETGLQIAAERVAFVLTRASPYRT